MACFIAPLILAVITSIIQKTCKNLAEKLRLNILNALLWGGVILLTVEHIWHGEVVPWPPFLTAMKTPAEISVMLHEIATLGSAMSMATILVWTGILGVSKLLKIYPSKIKLPKITAGQETKV